MAKITANDGELQRKKRAARNTWFKLYRPIIETGEKQGQRDYQRSVKIQIIPEESFNVYGDKKTNGFTLSEVKGLIENGGVLENHREDDMEGDASYVTATVKMGDRPDEFSKKELQHIVRTMEKEGGVYNQASPFDREDYDRLNREGRWDDANTIAPGNGSTSFGPSGGETEQSAKIS